MKKTEETADPHADLLAAVERADSLLASGHVPEARAWLRVVKKLEVERRNRGGR